MNILYKRLQLIFLTFIIVIFTSSCIGNIGELSGLLSGHGGSIYYVSPEGNNNSSGNRENPWATPGYASRQLEPGDTLIILGGEYKVDNQTANQLKPPSGSSSSWITIKGEAGNRPILKGRDNCTAVIDLSGKSYVQIENLEITNDEGSIVQCGIKVVGGVVQNLIFKDLFIHHIDGNGIIMADAYGIELRKCTIEYCGREAMVGKNFQGDGWNRVIIQDSHFAFSGHYPSVKKQQTEQPLDGLRIESSVGPVEINNSVFENNQGNGVYSKAKVNRISQCIVDNNKENGIVIGGEEGTIINSLIYGISGKNPGELTGSGILIDEITKENAVFKVINVTVDNYKGSQGSPLKVGEASQSGQTGEFLLKNSIIFCGSQPVIIDENITFKASHNLIYQPEGKPILKLGTKEYTAEELKMANLIDGFLSTDPLFVSPSRGKNGGYHIQENSPARNAGTSDDAPSIDLEGKSRPQGEGYDLGAYEFEEKIN